MFLLLFIALFDRIVVSGAVLERSSHDAFGRNLLTDGWRTKTHTVETDDDSVDGGTHTHERTVDHTSSSKPKDPSPYGVTKSADAASIPASVVLTTDDNITSELDDRDSNMTSFMDILDIVHQNYSNESSMSTLVLPTEKDPTETWTIAIVALFSSMAISLCTVTGWRRWCRDKRREGYHEITNLVV